MSGQAHAELESWSEASRDLCRAVRLGADDRHTCTNAAVAALAGQDLAAYRDICGRMLRRYEHSNSSDELGLTVWTCVLGPAAVQDLRRVDREDAAATAPPPSLTIRPTTRTSRRRRIGWVSTTKPSGIWRRQRR